MEVFPSNLSVFSFYAAPLEQTPSEAFIYRHWETLSGSTIALLVHSLDFLRSEKGYITTFSIFRDVYKEYEWKIENFLTNSRSYSRYCNN